jgi:hypothetical protein
MNEGGDVRLGVRMALVAAVSALVVAALTIVIGRALIVEPTTAHLSRSEPLVLVSR